MKPRKTRATPTDFQRLLREYCDPNTPNDRKQELEQRLTQALSDPDYQRQPGED